MRIEILDLAVEDLAEGFRFYEEREPGLGEYFLSTLVSDIESLAIFGGMHRQVYRDFHRLLSKRFPFAVYYTVEGEVVKIRAIVDCRRDPLWIREHLGGA